MVRKKKAVEEFNKVTVLGPRKMFDSIPNNLKENQLNSQSQIEKSQDKIKLYRNEKLIEIIKNCLKTHKPLIVKGIIGCGKSFFIKTVVEELGYQVIEYDDDFKEETIESFKASLTIKKKFGELFKLKPIVYLLKHYDLIKNEYIKDIFDILKNGNLTITVFFTTCNLNKSFRIPKFIETYHFEEPTISDFLEVYKHNKTNYRSFEESKLIEIAKNCYGDIRMYLNILNSGEVNFKDTDHEISQLLKHIYEKNDIEYGINFGSIHVDSVMSENYITLFIETLKNKTNETKYEQTNDKITEINDLSELADNIAISDLYQNYVSNNQTWDVEGISDMSVIHSTLIPFNIYKNYNSSPLFKNIKYSANSFSVNTDKLNVIAYIFKYIFKNNYELINKFVDKYVGQELDDLRIICKISDSDIKKINFHEN